MKSVVISRSRFTLWGCVLVGILFCITFFIGPIDSPGEMFSQNPGTTVFAFAIVVGMILYGSINLLTNKPDIVLSSEGIELRENGFNHWEYVSSISTVCEKDNESSDKDYLVIGLKDFREIRFDITDLNRPPWEILQLTRDFKNSYVVGSPDERT